MRTIVVTSLALNAVLLGALAFVSVRGPAVSPPEAGAASQIGNPSPSPTRLRNSSRVMMRDASDFHWSEIESADFKEYMVRLRDIGCPEETIRDLIIAEVNKMFAPRYAALAAETQKVDYWSRRSKSRETLTARLRELQAEKGALLQELLGIDDDPNAKWANVDVDRLREEGKYSFLSLDKQAQVRAIMEKYQQQLEAGRAGRNDLLAVDGDQAKRLREQRQQELAQLLTPDEFKELSLRDSNTADSVRNRFGAADLTEAEYRAMFDLRKAYEDEQGAVADYSNPDKVRQRSEARRQLEEAYKTAIGEDRWNEIQRQQDPTWRGLTEFAQQNNVSQSVVDQAWQNQRQTGEQIMRLMNDQSISREQRESLVQQLTSEYDRSLKNLLGDQAYQQYKQTHPEFTFSSGAGDAFTFIGPSGAVDSASVTVSPSRTQVRTRIEAR